MYSIAKITGTREWKRGDMLAYRIPKTPPALMLAMYRKIFPEVNRQLAYWKKRAEQIPNRELRTQALASIAAKRFHCQGGAVYALVARDKWKDAIRFIVAYQTISDYLDNLCDRSTSLDPADFRLLHRALIDALTPENVPGNYYSYRKDRDDSGYLADLARTCQAVLHDLRGYETIRNYALQLDGLYNDLQVHKHVKWEERIPRLEAWHNENKVNFPDLGWYEFSAASGSTLGVFCLVSYAMAGGMTNVLATEIYRGYFPFMQGLHILLDYYVDQDEDIDGGDLNFCKYYESRKQMMERFQYFMKKADQLVRQLPDSNFHAMVRHGLIGLYLGDPKVALLDGGSNVRKKLLETSGWKAKFFYWNTKMYHWKAKNPGMLNSE